ADAGASWERHELGITADLQAIAIAEDHDGAAIRVVLAGDGVLMSRGASGSFAPLTIEARGFTSVALDHHGERLLAVADDGSIWRADGAAAPEHVADASDRSLYAVSLDAAGEIAVVVGSEGYLAMSHDGGTSWQPQLLPTVRDLFAVRLSFQGDTVIAVGEAGTVVRIDDGGTTARELLDPSLALRGVHLHAQGAGHAVGDAGTVLFTTDLGLSWQPLDADTDAVLRGVDDFHLGAHF
ncbi:MAG: hypothetical protein IAG13_24385, partial [Deltaproteobacteria bacterium]|nr:hypothetical protein [Nannocystaceae bacterium]